MGSIGAILPPFANFDVPSGADDTGFANEEPLCRLANGQDSNK